DATAGQALLAQDVCDEPHRRRHKLLEAADIADPAFLAGIALLDLAQPHHRLLPLCPDDQPQPVADQGVGRNLDVGDVAYILRRHRDHRVELAGIDQPLQADHIADRVVDCLHVHHSSLPCGYAITATRVNATPKSSAHYRF